MILEGTVKSGMGEAKYWMEKAEKILENKLKMKMYHGTLNVTLKDDYKIQDERNIIKGSEYGGTQNLYIDKCVVFEDKAFIIRTEKNESGNGDHPLNIVEIISNINFREKYNLKDGDKVEIKID